MIDLPQQPSHPVNSVIRVRCAETPRGDDYRLVEADRENRLHIADTPFLAGKEIKQTNGAGATAHVGNWSDPNARVTWKVRCAQKAEYAVHILYDPPKSLVHADRYQVQIAHHRLQGTVTRTGTGDPGYVDRETALMRMHSPRSMVTDALGTVLLEPGAFDITLSAAGEMKNKTLFRPRAVLLVPEGP